MTEYTDGIDDLYRKAQSGEPRLIRLSVSDELDVEILPPDDVNKAGLVRILENENEADVTIFPGEIRALIEALSEAAGVLAAWAGADVS